MHQFQFHPLNSSDLVVVQPFIASDVRGYLSKTYEYNIFREHGINFTPMEELESSSKRGVIRGLHFQYEHGQDKLVRVLHGAVYDVAVDLRRDSPTFGHWKGVHLSAENHTMFYIPKGFAHGFLSLSQESVLHYLCGDTYTSGAESGIRWDDPELVIDWPLEPGIAPTLSERDLSLPTFDEFKRSIGAL